MNTKMIEFLHSMEKQMRAQKEPFKARAYQIASQNLAQVDTPITEESQLDIKGIGSSIKKKLVDILHGNEPPVAENPTYETVSALSKVWGIGPAKANLLVKEHGVTGLEHLKELYEQDNSLLTKNQWIGLQYHDQIQKRIPRTEMLKHEAHLKTCLGDTSFDIAGSFRREKSSSGDIDILIRAPIQETVARLQKYIVETLALGDSKFMGLVRLPRHKTARRLDIMRFDDSVYPFALLHFTGSDDFNVAIRNHAISLGVSLSEHGFKQLEPKGQEIVEKEYKTEEDIFDALGLQYVAPKNRAMDAVKPI